MINQFEKFLEVTQFSDYKVISRAQLPLWLAKVNGLRFSQLLLEGFGVALDEDPKHWFSLDGKELLGSIKTGHTRGEVCVCTLAHQTQQTTAHTFYSGTKESERSAVRHLLEPTSLCGQKLTLVALHLIPSTLRSIHAANGIYVVSLKANQAHLYRYCLCQNLFNGANYKRVDKPIRRHGRFEQRTYRYFSLTASVLARR